MSVTTVHQLSTAVLAALIIYILPPKPRAIDLQPPSAESQGLTEGLLRDYISARFGVITVGLPVVAALELLQAQGHIIKRVSAKNPAYDHYIIA